LNTTRSKIAVNRTKHGLSLGDVMLLDWERAFIYPDTRFDYGQTRMIGLVPLGARLHTVVFVDCGAVRRIISLRKAHKKEIKSYVQRAKLRT